jgi:hypothetical protein
MSTMDFSPDNLRKRFHDLGVQRAAKLAVSSPIRAERDAEVARHNAVMESLKARVQEAEAGLYDIDVERGMLARALMGKTGEPPAA